MAASLTAPRQTAENKKEKSTKKRGTLPTKRSVNFIRSRVTFRQLLRIPAFLVLFIAVLAFIQFGIINRLAGVAVARFEVSQVQQKINEGLREVATFGEIQDKYAHYTYSGMTEEELSRADRPAVMDMIERSVMPRASQCTWNLTGNQLTMQLTVRDLETANQIVRQLNERETLVNYCTLTTAENRNNNGENESVTASLTVYLNDTREVSEK